MQQESCPLRAAERPVLPAVQLALSQAATWLAELLSSSSQLPVLVLSDICSHTRSSPN